MAAISAAELDATWRQLERVPRPDLARALARAQELGAAAFKRKDYQGAYDHYNQAVTGLEYLARTGADATERDAVRALANRSACKLGRGDAGGAARTRRSARAASRRGPRPGTGWGGPSHAGQVRRRVPGVRRGRAAGAGTRSSGAARALPRAG